MKIPSLGGAKYSLAFTDDFSRKVWVYFLKKKSETFEKFKDFKKQVETESGKKIKVLRTDGGGEYGSREFKRFCKANDIKRHLTATFSIAEWSSRVKKQNRTIFEMVRSMLKGKNLHHSFWAEVVHTTMYVMNQSPTKAVRNIIPEEAWSSRKPQVKHLRVYGSVAYVHILKEKRHKLEEKSLKCIFVGYSDVSKAYKLWDPEAKRVVISRDVIFGNRYRKRHLSIEFEDKKKEEPVTEEKTSKTPITYRRRKAEQKEMESEEKKVGSTPSTSKPKLKWYQSTIKDSKLTNTPLVEGETSRLRRFARLQTNVALMSVVANSLEPTSYKEAKEDQHWVDVMKVEYNALMKHKTWRLVKLPKEKEAIGCKWVFRMKYKVDGTIDKHKARLVEKGYTQKEGIDYEETFAPTTKMITIRLVLAIAAQLGWQVHQMDVKSAFLNGDLKEEVYMQQPEGFELKGKEKLVCKLNKPLYGLKQPHAWYIKIDEHLRGNSFQRSASDPNLYVKKKDGDLVILVVYVDDLVITGNSLKLIDKVKGDLGKAFEMTDLGLMEDCKPMDTPMEAGLKLTANEESKMVDEILY
eukprot:Gb_29290 [translate_table: standard]